MKLFHLCSTFVEKMWEYWEIVGNVNSIIPLC